MAAAAPIPFALPDHQATLEHVEPLRWPQRAFHIVLAATGSVASVKIPLITAELLKLPQVEVQIVATESSLHFFDASQVESDSKGRVRVWSDADEWTSRKAVSDPILHIELRRWADLVLVAPCSANTLAKIAGGLCDNLLTSMLRALDPSATRVLLFPAMNTHMYRHPLTASHLDVVKRLGYDVHGPISKGLACGDLGIGAMTEWTDIVELVRTDVLRLPPAADNASS